MKLSKKLLSMVLCGLIVVGGNQATLVNANAQTQSRSIAATDKVPHAWTLGVRFQLQTKLCGLVKDWWELELISKDGNLQFKKGPTDIPCHLTFNDTFIVGWKKSNKKDIDYTVFRNNNGADAGNALGRMINMFNNAKIGVGDIIFMSGKKSNNSIRFSNHPDLVIHSLPGYNDYSKGYPSIDRNMAGFLVKEDGLYPVNIDHGNLY